MADSPTLNTDGPVGIEIRSAGAAIPDDIAVISVNTSKETGRIPTATVVMETGSIPTNEFPDVDGDTFKLGKEIEIKAFYGNNPATVIFKGILFAKRLRIDADSGAELVLTLRDKAQKMNVVAANGQYLNQKDSDVMTALLGNAGLTAQVSATAPGPRDQVRHNCTDWELLRALADRNGMLVYVDDGEVKVDAPDPAKPETVRLTLGVDIISFDAQADTQYLFASSTGTSWDDAAQTIVGGDGGSATALRWGNVTFADLAKVAGDAEHALVTPATHAQDEMNAFSKARLARAALSSLRGQVTFIGYGAIKPGDTVELTGVGDAFGGTAFVNSVAHRIEAGDWTTALGLGVPEGWRSDDAALGGAAAGGVTTPVHGLHIGKVTKIVEDEAGRLRIQVSLPVHGAEETLLWARYATPYATGGAGVFFMPEIDDEVVIGYLGSDPDSPVVLGSMHNGTTAQPFDPDEPNTYKAIVTKNQLIVEFEDAKKIITISTPGGHKVTMDDDAKTVTLLDSNGNKMEMSSSGITMTSPGDITISADGNVSISATGDASVEGSNVDVTAQAQLTASGTAGAELSASGQTVVKGSMVMIN